MKGSEYQAQSERNAKDYQKCEYGSNTEKKSPHFIPSSKAGEKSRQTAETRAAVPSSGTGFILRLFFVHVYRHPTFSVGKGILKMLSLLYFYSIYVLFL